MVVQPEVIFFEGKPAGIDWGDRLGYFPFIEPEAKMYVEAKWIEKYNKRTVIAKVGQKYVEDAVSIECKPTQLAVTVALAFKDPDPPLCLKRLEGFSRTNLRWMKPDGQGGLIPKYKEKT